MALNRPVDRHTAGERSRVLVTSIKGSIAVKGEQQPCFTETRGMFPIRWYRVHDA